MAGSNIIKVVFEAAVSNLKNGIKNVNGEIKKATNATDQFGKSIKTMATLLTAGLVANAVKNFASKAINEYGKTQTALGELASLGIKDLESIRQSAIKFSNTWSGTTREEFISASYDIKSGIASLTDEGVAKFTELAALTGKATKSTVGEMTTLFAQGYGIYRDLFDSDFDFGEKFSAGISNAVQKFRTQGSEMSSYISSLGASATSAGYDFSEVLAIGGTLQMTMTGSEAATKFAAFLRSANKAGEKLGLNFLDANNQLSSVPEIIEIIKQKYGEVLDTMEADELTEAFGRKEAFDLVKNLYSKTELLKISTNEIAESVARGAQATEEMAQAMNTGMAEKTKILGQRLNNIFEEIGMKMEPHIQEAFTKLFEVLDRFASDGTLDSIAESVGQMTNTVVNMLIDMLDKVPDILNTVSGAFQWLAENLGNIIEMVKIGIALWIGYKGAMLLVTIATNPVIALIGIVIGAIVKLYMESEKFRRFVKFSMETTKLGFLQLVRVFLDGFVKVTNGLAGLTSGIPALSDVFKKASDSAKNSLRSVDKAIQDTTNNLRDLLTMKDEVNSNDKTTFNNPATEVSNMAINLVNKNLDNKSNNISSKSKNEYEETAAGNLPKKEKKDDRTPFEKAKDELEEKYSSREDLIKSQIDYAVSRDDTEGVKKYRQAMIDFLNEKLVAYAGLKNIAKTQDEINILETASNTVLAQIEDINNEIKNEKTLYEKSKEKIDEDFSKDEDLVKSQIELAEAKKDKKGAKTLSQTYKDMLNEQFISLLGLEKFITNSDERKLWEIDKNKMLTKIANVINDIKENTAELVGNFNAPSELDTLSKYGYLVQTSNNRQTNTNQTVIFNIQGLDENTEKEVEARMKKLYSRIFKDDIVEQGLRDEARN